MEGGVSDRRLWLAEACLTCSARSGLRCQTSHYRGKPTQFLHAARGWRQRSCPACKAPADELCKTPTGRQASQPHAARLAPGRRELFADEQVWEELERWEAASALVRFSGGGGNQGVIAVVTLEDAQKRELARWGRGEGELPEALAAPIWGRFALFRGHPRITGLLMWDAQKRQVLVAGERGGRKFEELLFASRKLSRPAVTPVAVTTGDGAEGSAAPARVRGTSPAAGAGETSRSCERCGEPLPAGLRPEARYCSKRCRQAASRARLKDRPPSLPPRPPETCSWCEGPMPVGLRVEAQFCSKRCRQAASRHALRLRRGSARTSGPHEHVARRRVEAQG
jgi:predicted nucleic acid-binding Zn ribbon protein